MLTGIAEQHALDREASIEKLCGLIREYVEPEAWSANGGNVAKLTVVGTRIFVRAAARHLAEIEWILAQLSDGADVEARCPRKAANPR